MHPSDPNWVFGGGTGHIDDERAEAINAIAERHGASFVAVDMPNGGPRFWFETPRKGPPFDGQVERAVLADVKREMGGVKPPIVSDEDEIGARK